MEKTYLANIIRERRAIKKGYNDKTVTEEVVRDLLQDARWAPTHGMREPWRFIFVGEEELPVFAKRVASTYPEERQENRENYLNEPNAILVAVMNVPELEKQWDENFGAIATLIQNFWLLAWEKQLGVVWKTNPHIYEPKVKEILDVTDNEKIVGFIHLGYFDEKPAPKERTPLEEKFTRFKA
ncbi:nitroreductase family protein [Oceanobacillus alkalisoli]|uniref:nitroreductase family protein n=1 Tax=Oceanobacillus alkalisoli TaxID=2925113 RepID=UPI001EF11FAF|nr:nitroreductase [Oceanobacillus alkalisoli]MCF3944814.1 nitroreductase [Oceanobacillus alkalisoli]MCG5104736.1 nitroreductase [Oceanobacillus alkalisoli]